MPGYPRGRTRLAGWVGIAGVLGFGTIVLALQHLQPAYDVRHQLLSELALGPYGWAMKAAFGSVALSLFGVQFGLGTLGVARAPRTLLGAAGVSMLAAGAFSWGQATRAHIAAVLMTLGLIAAAAYLLPARAGRLPTRAVRGMSWLLGSGTVASLAAANCGVSLGIAQRLAVACVLGWLCWLSWRLVRA